MVLEKLLGVLDTATCQSGFENILCRRTHVVESSIQAGCMVFEVKAERRPVFGV